ncbi:MAG: hypothetical protein UV64_C0007G0019 [Parcubacteria group bacterium GW2011_GWC1_43_11b]|nr:MAG: hypothetical protein UV64_C0007G0019 [Parcubacteria group bacterium GW2011_GWC1_43_11b]
MKIRTAFVSNSSSCSFVIGKAYMTKEQQEAFRDWLKITHLRDTYIGETKHYFLGGAKQDEVDKIMEFLQEQKLDTQFAETYQ